MVFGSSFPHYLKKRRQSWPPLAKLSGSAHARSNLSGDDSVACQVEENGIPFKRTNVPSQEEPKIGPLSDSGPRLDTGCPGWGKSQYLAIAFFFRNTSYGNPMARIATNGPGFIVTISKTGSQGIDRTNR